MNAKRYKGPLHEMTMTTNTDFWNDSCSIRELEYAISHGAVGATTNPVIVGNVLQSEMDLWEKRIKQVCLEMPNASDDEITWKINEEMAVKASELLMSVFRRENELKGRISIQTNAKNFRNCNLMVRQAGYFNTLSPNMQVKIPGTQAGIKAIEEATAQGVNINATLCFTVPQAIAVAEATEKGLTRRESKGIDTGNMSPVCAIMVGRLDDWLKVVSDKQDIITDPSCLEWAGVAVFKRAYEIFSEKKYCTRLLAAAYRNHFHWSEFIGGDVILTIPYNWQRRFNSSDVEVKERMSRPVDKKVTDELMKKFSDFKKAYEPNGLTLSEFDSFGATRRTLRSFIEGYDKAVRIIRDRLIPNPDA